METRRGVPRPRRELRPEQLPVRHAPQGLRGGCHVPYLVASHTHGRSSRGGVDAPRTDDASFTRSSRPGGRMPKASGWTMLGNIASGRARANWLWKTAAAVGPPLLA